ncbi:glutamate-5-semialdehyde dehydrogenase [Nitrospirillum sp. BR 11163]|uniref:glutamate-5-semialdehyde dehydrogenase n=1 Tax=Nitrospirillum sp. BR 11163 TaxID=3104323 RepID=UPI002B002E36|nr:glutamate-5-semialdehyde dehydrogenase [Nitrospirillum sp. BR 11163]MEA1675608.1 glutamate-5-semialdehyde dehydrogenase [Nitrospirillum sp. BR 11163]
MDGQTVDLTALMRDIGQRARAASAQLAVTTPEQRVAGLRAAAAALRGDAATILDANARDMAAGQAKGLTSALLDRLRLDEGRLEAIATGLEDVADLPDPLGAVMADWTRPNGLRIQRVRVPLGVIGIIYESRPNVTADAGGLCVKSGNAAILRGGSESLHSSSTIVAAMRRGLVEGGLPADAVQLVPTTDRAAVGILLTMTDHVDVIIPRGGKSLTARVAAELRVPVIKHLDGICHVYLDKAADAAKARAIAFNAKMRRTGICGAMETLLVHRDVAATQLPVLIEDLIGAGCEVRGDATAQSLDARVLPADDADWDTEYLDAILSVKVVESVDEAIAHIERHGSHHTDSIVTEDAATAERFLARVDSGIVLWNASTQFADGGEFGFGAEIGISTGKLHARGPVGAEQLTSYKYVVRGDGQTRP